MNNSGSDINMSYSESDVILKVKKLRYLKTHTVCLGMGMDAYSGLHLTCYMKEDNFSFQAEYVHWK